MAAMIFMGRPHCGQLPDVDIEHPLEQPGLSSWGQAPREGHLTVVR